MSSRERFRGVGVALVTPFRSDGALDEAALERLVEWQVEQGIDYLVPCGTTGENPALTYEEHLRVVEITVRRAAGNVPVLAGAGSNNTQKAIDFALAAADFGAEGILTITPYYNKPTPDGLLRHFGAQAQALDAMSKGYPMVLYNVPGRTGINMTAETTLRIAREIPNAIGVKEASADMSQILTILAQRPKDFLVISGDDAWTLPILAAGADGLISVAANEVPALMKEMVAAGLNGAFDRARAVHERLLPLMLGNFIESNPAPAKAVMKMMGILENDFVRSPLAPLSDASRQKLRGIIESSGLRA